MYEIEKEYIQIESVCLLEKITTRSLSQIYETRSFGLAGIDKVSDV
jgi:hypothetical protein